MLYNVIMSPRPRKQTSDGSRAASPDNEITLVSRQTLADSVYEQLRTAIIKGRLRDGAEIKQVEFAAKMGVSRVPLREALRRLQAERLVAAEPFQCFVVTSLSTDQVLELLDLREELEVFALKKTLSSDSYQERVSNALEAAKAPNLHQDEEKWLEADREFHRALNGETTAVATIIEDVRERVHRYLYSQAADTHRRREVLSEHALILEALQARDEPALERAMRTHVQGTRAHLARSMGAQTDGLNPPLSLTSA